MTNSFKCGRGFTLVELLVVIVLCTVLATALLGGVRHTRVSARKGVCVNNLQQVGLALELFNENYEHYPSDSELPVQLARFLGKRSGSLVCPLDTTRSGNSYGDFYVCRNTASPGELLVVCPRHYAKGAISVFKHGGVQAYQASARTIWNGTDIYPGDQMCGGAISFTGPDDGAKLMGQYAAGLIQSVPSGRAAYTVLKPLPEDSGIIQTQITRQGKVEVLTSGALLAGDGTHFDVSFRATMKNQPKKWISKLTVRVTEGSITIHDFSLLETYTITAGVDHNKTIINWVTGPLSDYVKDGNVSEAEAKQLESDINGLVTSGEITPQERLKIFRRAPPWCSEHGFSYDPYLGTLYDKYANK